jgi:tetratricopeptide (TPR) repeat protein
LCQQCTKNDTLFVAFAGHGLKFDNIEDSFFCPWDAKPFDDEINTLISLNAVYREMEKSFAKATVLVVDACRDDPVNRRGGRKRGIDGESAPRPPKNVAVFFSCAQNQGAHERDDLKHGLFFHCLLQGLQGDSTDSDGDITLDRLAADVKKAVVQKTRDLKLSPQHPVFIAPEKESIVLVSADSKERVQQNVNAFTLRQQADRYLNETKYDLAIETYTKLLRLRPKDSHAFLNRGLAYSEKGDTTKAIEDYTRAIGADPEFSDAYKRRGDAYSDVEENDRAIADYTKSLSLVKDSDTYRNRGLIYHRKAEYQDAVRDYDSAIKLNPQDGDSYKARGNSRLKLREYEKAVADYSKAIEIDADDAQAYYNRGVARQRLGESESAKRDFDKAYDLDPKLRDR